MTMVYTFIAEEKANPDCEWSVAEMCRVLEVSRSGVLRLGVPAAVGS